ncbi:MAG: sigma-70 family RNA polymerase sigma factor [Saprospiraceae bacterium]|nr:sigma-70 family RNA polymerase sigma factor [Saprospiraceae bacterium]
MKLSDLQILEHLKAGGPRVHKVMDYLYLRSRTKIIGLVKNNGGSKEDGQDILQETLIAFYTNVLNNKFRAESDIEGYLYGIARFKWLKALKEKQKLRKLKERKPKSTVTAEDESIHKSYASLQHVMQKLNEGCRELLIHAFYFNFSADEISKKFNYKNEQVARNKKYKCLKKLREMIEKAKTT